MLDVAELEMHHFFFQYRCELEGKMYEKEEAEEEEERVEEEEEGRLKFTRRKERKEGEKEGKL